MGAAEDHAADVDQLVTTLRNTTPLGRLTASEAREVFTAAEALGWDMAPPEPGLS